MIPTEKMYFTNNQQLFNDATVLQVTQEQDRTVIILDKTSFYPQGGGQPSDKGIIQSSTGLFKVEDVRLNEELVKHYGHFVKGELTENQSVSCEVNHETRQLHNRLHSAGHVIDMAVFKLGLNWTPEKGHHFPGNSYVEYNGILEIQEKEKLKQSIEKTCNQLIQDNEKTAIRFISKNKLSTLCHFTPSYIPPDSSIRLIVFGHDFCIPCGGTHVTSLVEIKQMTLRKIKMEKGKIRVSYAIMNESTTS